MNVQTVNLGCWEEFEEQLRLLQNERLEKNVSDNFIYRGQSNNSWSLSTTLERIGKKDMSLKEYHRLIFVIKHQIESFNGVQWDILFPDDFDGWLKENDTIMPHAFGFSRDYQNIYSYMVYLRHHGFPSPLLDWSSSPYVGAYFAYRDIRSNDKMISIYCFLKSAGPHGETHGGDNSGEIYPLGPYVKTDKRHFLQQSWYTICIRYDLENGEWQYAQHDGVFDRGDRKQDILYKFNIPNSERLKVLKKLDGYNINAFSLFGSEESLMETMAFREIHFLELDY